MAISGLRVGGSCYMANKRKLDWKRKADVEQDARRVLTTMARDFFAAGRKVVHAQPDPAELHEFRLHTKRFRYTLAMFEPLYGPSMQKQLALLKPVQDALGQVNDCVATAEAFPGNEAFDLYLNRRASRKAKEFYRAWKRQFDSEGQEEKWTGYLSGLGEVEPAVDSESLTSDEVRAV